MCMHCDNEYILQEGGTVLSKWHVRQCALYLGSSLCAKTDLSQWKPSGAFRYAFVLNQTNSCANECRNALAMVKSQGKWRTNHEGLSEKKRITR